MLSVLPQSEERELAVEEDEVAMVRASLGEYLALARLGIDRKEGVLGYPTATVLFAFIDSIGSYHRDVAFFTVRIDDKEVGIALPEHHMRILNSDYFGLTLTGEQINRIYRLARSPLTHNGLVGAGVCLWPGEADGAAIDEDNGLINVRLAGFLTRCEEAHKRFMLVADKIVPGSAPIRELHEKEDTYEAQIRKSIATLDKLGPIETMQASAMGSDRTRLRWRR
jgi:hypothetical protein